jgi:hypothetical protein
VTEPEFKRIAAAVIALWPNSGWPDATIAIAWQLLHGFKFEHVSKAVVNLSKEGREFAPPPGVVFVHAETIERAERPLLPEPDPSPADWERGRRAVKEIMRQIADIAAGRQLTTTKPR